MRASFRQILKFSELERLNSINQPETTGTFFSVLYLLTHGTNVQLVSAMMKVTFNKLPVRRHVWR